MRLRINELQNDIRAFAKTGAWEAVLAADAELSKLDPEEGDPDGLATKAHVKVLEGELAADYARGVQQLDDRDWALAEATFSGLLDRQAGYRDAESLLGLAQRRGRPPTEPPPPPDRPPTKPSDAPGSPSTPAGTSILSGEVGQLSTPARRHGALRESPAAKIQRAREGEPASYMNTLSELVDADTLTFTDQTHLVAELRDHLSRSSESSDQKVAVEILRRLRRRPDITERVRRDINELLHNLALNDPTQGSTPVSALTANYDEATTASAADVEEADPDNEEIAPQGASAQVRHSRPAILLIVGAAAVLAIIAVTAVLLSRRGAENSESASPSPSAESAGPLPASSPLASTQLIVPMEVARDNWALYLADTGSPSPGRQLTSGKGYVSGPVVSPDRRTVIYVAADNAHVFSRSLRVAGAADLSGDRELVLPDGCDRPVRPAWNPADPTTIGLICITKTRKHVLRVISIDGSDFEHKYTAPTDNPRLWDPSFSSDGKVLGFWAGPADSRYDGGTLYTVPTAGGTPKPLLDPDDADGRDLDLTFSPDGRYVVFVRRPPSGESRTPSNIMRARADGSHVISLTDESKFGLTDPSWSPDSKRLAYVSTAPPSDSETEGFVWTMTSDGKDQHLLWTNGAERRQAGPGWTHR